MAKKDFDDYGLSMLAFDRLREEFIFTRADLMTIEMTVHTLVENQLDIGLGPDHLANLADLEKGNFNHFKTLSVISMYSFLEAAIKELLIAQFTRESGRLMQVKVIRDISISVIEYGNMDEENRIEYLVNEYEKKVARGERYGVNRFEALLEPIGFGGPVSKELRREF